MNTGEKVHITVGKGEGRAEYVVAKKLLASHSKFFAISFDNGFRESIDQAMSLPEDSVEQFEDLLVWICVGKVPVADRAKTRLNFVEHRCGLRPLIKLHAFAHRLLVPSLQKVTFAKIRTIIETDPDFLKLPGLSPDSLDQLLDRTVRDGREWVIMARWVALILQARSESPAMYSDCFMDYPSFTVEVMKAWQVAMEDSQYRVYGERYIEASKRRVLVEDGGKSRRRSTRQTIFYDEIR